MIAPKKIIISRTDAIGDVVLTLPMAGVLKKFFPDVEIIFLGRTYTKPVVDTSAYVDSFLNWDDVSQLLLPQQKDFLAATKADCIVHVFPNKRIAQAAKSAGTQLRIGTTNRLFHWMTCNKLVRLSRKNSNVHEAQLNLKLLEPLIGKQNFSLESLPAFYGLSNVASLPQHLKNTLHPQRFNLILHPKSKGHGREWSLDNFSELIHLLPQDRFKIFISGSKDEGTLLKDFIEAHKELVTDITGKMTLTEFVSFIHAANGLVASGTGPLHVAAALGKNVVGLFPSIRPIFPQRWGALGFNATSLSKNKECNECRVTNDCRCMNEITPQQVFDVVSSWKK